MTNENENAPKSVKVAVVYQIKEERLQDLLCSALEGGSNYWYTIDSFNYPEGQNEETMPLKFRHLELPFRGGSLTISDIDGDPAYSHKVLDLKAMKKGLRRMALHHPQDFDDFMNNSEDANTGDIFLQLSLFGEVIFG